MIDLIRFQRYQLKINNCETRIEYCKDWMNDEFDNKTRFAIYKGIQEIVESLTDIISMMVKDLKIAVKDDYSNFDSLLFREIITENQNKILSESNGLRNRIVHSYNGIDDDVAISSFTNLLPGIEKIMEVFQEWIEKHSE